MPPKITPIALYTHLTYESNPSSEERQVEGTEVYKYLKEHYSEGNDLRVLNEFSKRREKHPFIRSFKSIKKELGVGFFAGIKLMMELQAMVKSGHLEEPIPGIFMIPTRMLDDAGIVQQYLDEDISSEQIFDLACEAAITSATYTLAL